MLKFYCFLLGEEYELLRADTPESRRKVHMLGTALLLPVFLWFFQGFFLASTILRLTTPQALLCGLGASIMIFGAERLILLSSSKSRWLVGVRVILGVATALVGSIIVDEILFHNDISNNMPGYIETKITEASTSVEEKFNPQVDSLRKEVDLKYGVWMASVNEVKAEADGSGGSGKAGVSEITRTKLALTDIQKSNYEEAMLRQQEFKARYDSELGNIRDEFKKNFNPDSLLTRMNVMFALIGKSRTMLFWYLVFTIIFFIIEILVVLVKTFSQESNYERKLRLIEEVGRHRMDAMLLRELETYNPSMEMSGRQRGSQLVDAGRNGYMKIG